MKHGWLVNILFLVSSNSQAQKISEIRTDNRISILDNKAWFRFPSSTKIITKDATTFSALPGNASETKLVSTIDNKQLTFSARELFLTCSGKDFFTTVTKDDQDEFVSKVLVDRDSIIAVYSTPLQFDTTESSIMINNLLVRMPDGTVFGMAAYVNKDGYDNRKVFQLLAEKTFASIEKGDRRVITTTHNEIYPIKGTTRHFSIEVPYGYAMSHETKDDLAILHIQKIKDIADTSIQELTITTGADPAYTYSEYEFSEDNAKKVKVKFLETNDDWLYFGDDMRSFYLKEQKIPLDKIQKDMIIHISMEATSQSGLEELEKIVQKIRLME